MLWKGGISISRTMIWGINWNWTLRGKDICIRNILEVRRKNLENVTKSNTYRSAYKLIRHSKNKDNILNNIKKIEDNYTNSYRDARKEILRYYLGYIGIIIDKNRTWSPILTTWQPNSKRWIIRLITSIKLLTISSPITIQYEKILIYSSTIWYNRTVKSRRSFSFKRQMLLYSGHSVTVCCDRVLTSGPVLDLEYELTALSDRRKSNYNSELWLQKKYLQHWQFKP